MFQVIKNKKMLLILQDKSYKFNNKTIYKDQ